MNTNLFKNLFFLVVIFISFQVNASELSDDNAIKFGANSDRTIFFNTVLLINKTLSKHLQKICDEISQSNGFKMKFKVRVINDPVVNAYSAAGGFIYINTGLLDVIKSKAQIAAIIAHEIAHIHKKHQLQVYLKEYEQKYSTENSNSVLDGLASISISLVTSTSTAPTNFSGRLISNFPKIGMNIIKDLLIANDTSIKALNGYSPSFELDADKSAIQYLRNTSYSPKALKEVLLLLFDKKGKAKTNNKYLYISHLVTAEPGLNKRIRQIEELL